VGRPQRLHVLAHRLVAGHRVDQLDALEAEINRLRERAGLPKVELTPVKGEETAEGQGGGGEPLSTEALLSLTSDRLKALMNDLDGQVEPALQDPPQPLRQRLRIPRRHRPARVVRHLDLRHRAGKVIEAGWSSIFGYYVKIDHGYGYRTLYGHMSKILVKRGERVERGQVIGRVGSTGRSSGPHVHYSVYIWGKAVNPVPYLEPPAYATR